MKPPPDLVGEEKLWLAVQKHLRKQGTWANTDAPLLEAYCRSVALARTAREASGAEPFVTGSRGQVVCHPALKVAANAEAAACRYAGALLLTPEARKRHDLAPDSDRDSLEQLLA